jgi:hypothetical protein
MGPTLHKLKWHLEDECPLVQSLRARAVAKDCHLLSVADELPALHL